MATILCPSCLTYVPLSDSPSAARLGFLAWHENPTCPRVLSPPRDGGLPGCPGGAPTGGLTVGGLYARGRVVMVSETLHGPRTLPDLSGPDSLLPGD